MMLLCQHCEHEYFADLGETFADPIYGIDCIWCPVCVKLTAVRIAQRLWKHRHPDKTDTQKISVPLLPPTGA